MALPSRTFYSIHEAAARWGCTLADIAGWAEAGHFDLITGISYAETGEETIAGKIAIHAMDVLPIFRRTGTGPMRFRANRIKPLENGPSDWKFITAPEGGIEVDLDDIMISSSDLTQFEIDCGIMRRAGQGQSKYDWDGMYVAACRRLFIEGLPASQTEFIREMEAWFFRTSKDGDAPDESSIRRKITPIWRELAGA